MTRPSTAFAPKQVTWCTRGHGNAASLHATISLEVRPWRRCCGFGVVLISGLYIILNKKPGDFTLRNFYCTKRNVCLLSCAESKAAAEIYYVPPTKCYLISSVLEQTNIPYRMIKASSIKHNLVAVFAHSLLKPGRLFSASHMRSSQMICNENMALE